LFPTSQAKHPAIIIDADVILPYIAGALKPLTATP
jgi:hypothetical protein